MNKSPLRPKLRIADVKQRQPGSGRLMNMKIPVALWDAIERLAQKLGANKTETVVALLNAAIEERGLYRHGVLAVGGAHGAIRSALSMRASF